MLSGEVLLCSAKTRGSEHVATVAFSAEKDIPGSPGRSVSFGSRRFRKSLAINVLDKLKNQSSKCEGQAIGIHDETIHVHIRQSGRHTSVRGLEQTVSGRIVLRLSCDLFYRENLWHCEL